MSSFFDELLPLLKLKHLPIRYSLAVARYFGCAEREGNRRRPGSGDVGGPGDRIDGHRAWTPGAQQGGGGRQQIMGYSPLTTAITFGPFLVPLGIFSALSFWYVPKLGLRLVLFVGTLFMAVGFACMHGLDLRSTYLEFCWPTLILATGIGMCTAPTTSAIMGAVPDEKQGVASAVNDTSREMGGALGIAVAASILAGRYSQELKPQLTAFPEAVRGPATDSLATAVEVANKLGPQGQQLATLAKTAFLTALLRRPSRWR